MSGNGAEMAWGVGIKENGYSYFHKYEHHFLP